LKKNDPSSTLTFNYTISGTTIKKDGVNDVVVEGDRAQDDFNNKSYVDLVRDGIIITR